MPLIGGKPILAPRSVDISPQTHTNGKSAFAPQALGKGLTMRRPAIFRSHQIASLTGERFVRRRLRSRKRRR